MPRRAIRMASGGQPPRGLGRAAGRPVPRHVPDPEQVLPARRPRHGFPRQRLGANLGIRRFVVGLSIAAAAAPAAAQGNYPEQTVRILVGFTAGVAPDVTGRLLAEKLGAAWGKPVVVENITGAGGNIAADRLAKS